MGTAISVHNLRFETDASERRRAILAATMSTWDGEFEFEVAVPASGNDATILEDARQRLLRLFQDAAQVLARDGLHLR